LKLIVTCAGKGGVGKSCVAAYTAIALSQLGKKILLVELDDRTRSLELILGVDNAAFGALDVLAGDCEPGQAILEIPNYPGLSFMPAGDGVLPQQSERLADLLEGLGSAYDFVIVDGVDLDRFPIRLARTFLLVITPDTLSVRAGRKAAAALYSAGAREVRLVINSVPPEIIPIDGAGDFDDVIDQVGAQLIAVIPHSPKLAYAANNAKPLDPHSLTVKVYENLAFRLMGKRRPLLIR